MYVDIYISISMSHDLRVNSLAELCFKSLLLSYVHCENKSVHCTLIEFVLGRCSVHITLLYS